MTTNQPTSRPTATPDFAALASPLAVRDRHPDDVAVDSFVEAMKAKLAQKRKQGRTGWQTASEQDLSLLLLGHLSKGDPVDIGNFAMMLHQNGQRFACAPAMTGDEELWRVMRHAYDQSSVPTALAEAADPQTGDCLTDRYGYAAEIEALLKYLFPQGEPDPWDDRFKIYVRLAGQAHIAREAL